MSNTKEYAFVDATKPLTIHVTEADIAGAVPGDSRNCVITRALQREHKCFDIVLWRTVAYVRKREKAVPVRYQVTRSVHDTLVAFDASGRARPVKVTLVPPRNGIRKATYKSERFKEMRRRSAAKTKERKAKLRRRHTYTRVDPLTLMGVRNGSGARPPGRGRLARQP